MPRPRELSRLAASRASTDHQQRGGESDSPYLSRAHIKDYLCLRQKPELERADSDRSQNWKELRSHLIQCSHFTFGETKVQRGSEFSKVT